MNKNTNAQSTLLLVDDDADLLDGLARILNIAGHRCLRARNQEDACRLVQETEIDLMISDINLGGHSGLDLCARLRKEFGMQDLPVMFLSGAQIPDVISRAHAAGATYYLRKPFDAEVLLELVDKALWMPHLTRKQPAPTGA